MNNSSNGSSSNEIASLLPPPSHQSSNMFPSGGGEEGFFKIYSPDTLSEYIHLFKDYRNSIIRFATQLSTICTIYSEYCKCTLLHILIS